MDSTHIFKKRFGQNFLTTDQFAIELAEQLQPQKTDTIIEIGAGEGMVTNQFIGKVKKVFALDIDPDVIPVLKQTFKSFDNIEILNQDIMTWDFRKAINTDNYKVIGSLPYNIAKKIIYLFLTCSQPPTQMAFIVQKEVADNYTAEAPDNTFLSSFIRLYSDPEYISTVPKEFFYPEPKVDGAIITFNNIKPRQPDPEKLLRFIKIGFSSPRKKLSSNLSKEFNKQKVEKLLIKEGLTDTARAQELTLDNWIKLYKSLI